MSGYRPICELRFIERLVPADIDGDGNVITVRAVRILQQKWVSAYEGEPDEWRDVPFVSAETVSATASQEP